MYVPNLTYHNQYRHVFYKMGDSLLVNLFVFIYQGIEKLVVKTLSMLVYEDLVLLFWHGDVLVFDSIYFYNFSTDCSEGDYDEETELFEQETEEFMKDFVAKIFLEEYVGIL